MGSRASSKGPLVRPSPALRVRGTPASAQGVGNAEARVSTDPEGRSAAHRPPRAAVTRSHTKAGSAPASACRGALSRTREASPLGGSPGSLDARDPTTPDSRTVLPGRRVPYSRGSKMSQKENKKMEIESGNSLVRENVHFKCIQAQVSAEGSEHGVLFIMLASPGGGSNRPGETSVLPSVSQGQTSIRTQGLCHHGPCTCHCLGLPLI